MLRRPSSGSPRTNVDLERRALLSFERPPPRRLFVAGATRAYLENSIATDTVFFMIKRIRAYGGCLGARSR